MTAIKKNPEIFIKSSKFNGSALYQLAGDASARRYIRAKLGDKSAMIMDTPPEGENLRAFVSIGEWLYKNGYSAPEIMEKDMESGFLLLEDFGDDSFSKIMREQPKQEEILYEAAVDTLVEWREIMPVSLPAYNLEAYLREVSLFCDWFLPRAIGAEKAGRLRAEYLSIWEEILAGATLEENVFVHRDYHADNLMWLEGREGIKRVGLLDFQDALIGDVAYDMVSLLEDARRDVSQDVVESMILRYLMKTGAEKERFMMAYNVLGAQRNSKIIGIFVRLCERDGKNNYLKLLPRVWRYLEQDLKHSSLKSLADWLDINVPKEERI